MIQKAATACPSSHPSWERRQRGDQYQTDSEVVSYSQLLWLLESELGAALSMWGPALSEAGEGWGAIWGTLFTTGSATFYPLAGQGFSFIPWASISLGAAQYLSILPLWCNGLENGFWVSLNSGSNVSLDFDLEQIFSPIWASVPSSAKWGRQTHAPEVLVSREYCGWHTVGTQSMSTIIIWIHLTTTPCQYQDDF